MTGAAPAVEDRGRGTAAHGLLQKGGHEAAEPPEPEMIALGAGGGLKKSVHYADTGIESIRKGCRAPASSQFYVTVRRTRAGRTRRMFDDSQICRVCRRCPDGRRGGRRMPPEPEAAAPRSGPGARATSGDDPGHA